MEFYSLVPLQHGYGRGVERVVPVQAGRPHDSRSGDRRYIANAERRIHPFRACDDSAEVIVHGFDRDAVG